MLGKPIVHSTCHAKYGGILPRVNMPHFHYLIKPLDFYLTGRCFMRHPLVILPLDSAGCTFGPHFF